MDKQQARRILALVLIGFIVIIFGASIFFAIKGNAGAFLGLTSFNTVFVVVIYFLMRLNRYVHDGNAIDDDEEIDQDEINQDEIDQDK